MGETGNAAGVHLHIELWTPKYYPDPEIRDKYRGSDSTGILMNASKYINSKTSYVGKTE